MGNWYEIQSWWFASSSENWGGLVINIDIGGFHYIDGGDVEDSGAASITELSNGEERSVKGLYPVKFSSGWRQWKRKVPFRRGGNNCVTHGSDG